MDMTTVSGRLAAKNKDTRLAEIRRILIARERSAAQHLKDRLEHEKDPELLAELVSAVATLERGRNATLFLELCKEGAPLVRIAALKALGRSIDSTVLEQLRPYCAAPSLPVRAMAIVVLCQTGLLAERDYLEELLESREPDSLRTLLGVLRELRRSYQHHDLLQRLQSMTTDETLLLEAKAVERAMINKRALHSSSFLTVRPRLAQARPPLVLQVFALTLLFFAIVVGSLRLTGVFASRPGQVVLSIEYANALIRGQSTDGDVAMLKRIREEVFSHEGLDPRLLSAAESALAEDLTKLCLDERTSQELPWVLERAMDWTLSRGTLRAGLELICRNCEHPRTNVFARRVIARIECEMGTKAALDAITRLEEAGVVSAVLAARRRILTSALANGESASSN